MLYIYAIFGPIIAYLWFLSRWPVQTLAITAISMTYAFLLESKTTEPAMRTMGFDTRRMVEVGEVEIRWQEDQWKGMQKIAKIRIHNTTDQYMRAISFDCDGNIFYDKSGIFPHEVTTREYVVPNKMNNAKDCITDFKVGKPSYRL